MNELKPCPKCGPDGVPLRCIGEMYEYRVECVECYTVQTPWFKTPGEAESYWNAFAEGMKQQAARIAELEQQLSEKITGETSDGYHTFNELYHHRAVLFSVICRCFPKKAWKSRKHHDGTMYPGMFIVGIETNDGQATYHYDIEPYWDMFPVKELEQASAWDGHTPQEAIERTARCRSGRSRSWKPNATGCGRC